MIRVGTKVIDWHEGLTAGEVVRRVGYDFPYFFLTVNGIIVRSADLETHPVPDDADVQIHPIVAGG